MRNSVRVKGVALLVLLVVAACVWYAALREDRRDMLTVAFLDVGQGDAIFIDAPSGRQVLIDGGPDGTVVRRLSEMMPFYDRSIDVVIATHPDADHISGLIDVLARYRVSYIVQSSVLGSTPQWSALERGIDGAANGGAIVLTAQRGQVIDLGAGSPHSPHAYLEILSPDRAVANVDTNDACVVARVVYGNTSFMLPCDAPQGVENYLAFEAGSALHASVLKAGHHGSKTSSSPLFVGYVSPEYAVYSRGCNNKYGFPNAETVALFKRFAIPTLDTCASGTITFVSDGQTVALK